MEKINIQITKDTKTLHRMQIFTNGVWIGDYERSKEKEIPRKKIEIHNAGNFLVDIFNRYKRPFKVIWDKDRKTKVLKINDREICTIPENTGKISKLKRIFHSAKFLLASSGMNL